MDTSPNNHKIIGPLFKDTHSEVYSVFTINSCTCSAYYSLYPLLCSVSVLALGSGVVIFLVQQSIELLVLA